MLSNDLVVVLPGIMGSVLARGEDTVWAPSAGSVLGAVRSFGRSVTSLQLPEGIGDAHPGDGVEAVGLMPDLHLLPGVWTPVRGYDRLVKRLRVLGYREEDGNLLLFPYDWRLSNRYNGERLKRVAEPALERLRARGTEYADARLVLVCHSMGGLVARWYLERCGGAEVTRKLITLGTPYGGAVKALGQLVAGVTPGIGPLSLDLTAFSRSLPSLHQLLPAYPCLGHPGDKPEALRPLSSRAAVPQLSAAMVADAADFHRVLDTAEAGRPAGLDAIHLIVGSGQPTPALAQLEGDDVHLFEGYPDDALLGDGTVPAPGCVRADVPLDSPRLHHVFDRHGNLPSNRAALDQIEGVLRSRPIRLRAPGTVSLSVTAPELLMVGERPEFVVDAATDRRLGLLLTVRDESGRRVAALMLRYFGHPVRADLPALPPGAYSYEVGGAGPAVLVEPVAGDLLVWG